MKVLEKTRTGRIRLVLLAQLFNKSHRGESVYLRQTGVTTCVDQFLARDWKHYLPQYDKTGKFRFSALATIVVLEPLYSGRANWKLSLAESSQHLCVRANAKAQSPPHIQASESCTGQRLYAKSRHLLFVLIRNIANSENETNSQLSRTMRAPTLSGKSLRASLTAPGCDNTLADN
jgi:hypothetical protein